jgi:AcrR family transcriptional regulator
MAKGLSQRAHQQVLDTAAELFAENGIDATSVDAIAAASKVSKATIYNHWKDKEALCLEVLVHAHKLDDAPPEFQSGDLRQDMVAFLTFEPAPHKAALQKKLLPHLIAYSARNHEFGRAWRARVMERARAGVRALLRRGIGEGVFPATMDEELGVALLLGPMMFRHIFSGSMDKDWLAHGAVESFWKAYARPGWNNGSWWKDSVKGRRRKISEALGTSGR